MWGNKVECPYCDCENDVSEALQDLNSDNRTDWECGDCGEEFELHAEFNPTWDAYKIEYNQCGDCGKVERDVMYKGCVHPYPQKTESDIICRNCWCKGVLADMKGDE